MSGRPLRFLGGVGIGWIGLRTAMLWPPAAAVIERGVPFLPRALARAEAPPPATKVAAAIVAPRAGKAVTVDHPRSGATAWTEPMPSDRERALALALLSAVRFGEAVRPAPGIVPGLPGAPPPAGPVPAAARSRWSGSGWLFARGGRGIAPGGSGGQLGGAQAGLRLAYALDARHRMALAGRATTPLRERGTELAFGIEWQPTRAPVRLVAEHRFGVDGVRSAPAVGAVGGSGPVAIGKGFTAEGYAQAGVIGAGRGAYVDGAARLGMPVGTLGSVRFDLGAGAWGGAQKGAARLDIGPSLAVALPGQSAGLRLSIDWRQRVAGGARPGSGLVVSLGTDF